MLVAKVMILDISVFDLLTQKSAL